jgi:hypothetical protein
MEASPKLKCTLSGRAMLGFLLILHGACAASAATQEESCIVILKQSQNFKIYDERLSILHRMPSSALHGEL